MKMELSSIAQVMTRLLFSGVNFNKCIVKALQHGNFKMLEWLKEKGCICNENTFTSATAFGNIDGMMWLRVNECPWDERPFIEAAALGNLKVLDWLKINECPMPDTIISKNALEMTQSYDGSKTTDILL